MEPIHQSRIDIQYVFRVLFVIGLAASIFAYIQFQARNLINGPGVMLTNAPETVQTDRVINLEGVAENIVTLTLNGKPIYTDEHGRFKKTLVLENGYTIMTLRAEDRYGRTTTLSREFVYTPAPL